MKKPNFRARQLGRTLRRLRVQVGLGQDEVAARLRCTPSKISRIEAGQVPLYAEFQLLLDVYGVIVNDWDDYLLMYDRACERGWWHAYGLDDTGFVSLEAEASEIRDYQLGSIPGLFQTEAYMRAGFAQARNRRSEQVLNNQVAVRLRRQWRLTEKPGLALHAIIDETVLRRPVFDSPEQQAQLRRIIERGELPNVAVQVIPLSAGAHSGRDGSFTILSYAEPDEPDIAYVEHGFGSFQVEKEEEVAVARLAFDHLASIALGERDSKALIERVIAEI